MRPESRILNYIPKQFNSRLRTVSDVEFIVREEGKYQTRVKMGVNDLELSRKLKGTKKWERVKLPENLPEVELDRSPSKVVSVSPPPGRPGHTSRPGKRERVSSGGQSDVNTPKISRREGENECGDGYGDSSVHSSPSPSNRGHARLDNREAALKESIEAADLVGPATISPNKDGEGLKKIPDLGFIHSVTGTPIRKTTCEIEVPASPILSKSAKNPISQI